MTRPVAKLPLRAPIRGAAVLGRVPAVPVRGTASAPLAPRAREVVGAAAGPVGRGLLHEDGEFVAGAEAGLAAEAAVDGG